jgi:RNA polymerase sigma-70 factor (ECF subfamily)
MPDPSPRGFDDVLLRARDGQRDALDALFEWFRNYLLVLATTVVRRHLRGKADAADVVQEAMLRGWSSFAEFRGTTEAEWMGWLRRILSTTLINLDRRFGSASRDTRREQSLETSVHEASERLGSLLPGPDLTASQHMRARERGVALADALSRLDPPDRQVVELRILQGLEWQEIAELTGTTGDAARMQCRRALARLAALLSRGLP